jgi:hypothetical protein
MRITLGTGDFGRAADEVMARCAYGRLAIDRGGFMRITKLRQRGSRHSGVMRTLIAAGMVALGLGACGGDDEQTERTLRFTDREGQLSESVDAPPRTLGQEEITPGDQIVNTRRLLDGSGDRAGAVHEVCAVTEGRNRDATELCQGVVELDDGKLSFSKTQKLSGSFPPTAITGGTDAYEGATGMITLAGGTEIEIHLLLP